MAEMKKKIEEKEKKLMEVKEAIERIQSTSERELREYEETFNSVLQAVERLRSEVTEVIKDYERRKVTKAKEVMKELEQEVEELKWREANLAELSQIDDHIHVLKVNDTSRPLWHTCHVLFLCRSCHLSLSVLEMKTQQMLASMKICFPRLSG